MSNQRNVSVASIFDLVPGPKPKIVQKVFQQLRATEDQSIALAKVFKDSNYVTLDNLKKILEQQRLPAVEMRMVMAYFVGYLAAETFSSRFDTLVFGNASSSFDGGDRVISSSLIALINLAIDQGLLTLPNRIPGTKGAVKPPTDQKRRVAKKTPKMPAKK